VDRVYLERYAIYLKVINFGGIMVGKKEIVSTEKAPKAIGPYSAAVKAGNFVFTAGQLGIDPDSGEFVPGGIEAQTKKALENLSAVLDAAGTSLANVVKTTVFLDNMDDFSDMNGIYGQFFTENFPARSAVQAAKLPKGGLVEIEAVALQS
jgi:2-iminobutanoate/2-iminopropanoate deaminase